MKIWILQDYLRSGGTERQTVLLARAFTSSGHPTTLVSFRPGGTLAVLLGELPRKVLQPFDTTLNWFAPGLLPLARAEAADVVLCMGRMANCHAGRLSRALPRTVVVGTMRTGKPLPWLFRRSLGDVAHVVANSRESASILEHTYGLPPHRVSVIHNALVFPAAAAAPARNDTLRARHGASSSTCVLLCVGMLRPEKNQRTLIEIAAALGDSTDWQLWLAGEGSARADCEALAAKLGVTGRVKFLGFQSDPTPIYAAADIAVLASHAESLSNFLIEAQAHGLPAVAYNAGGVSECMRDKVSGSAISHGDQPAFLSALSALINDSALRAQQGAAARAFAREAFEPVRQAGRYLELFDRLASVKAS